MDHKHLQHCDMSTWCGAVCQNPILYLYLHYPFWKHHGFTCTHFKPYILNIWDVVDTLFAFALFVEDICNHLPFLVCVFYMYIMQCIPVQSCTTHHLH